MAADARLVRAVFLRFIPGCATTLGSVLGAVALLAPAEITAGRGAMVAVELLGLALGFATVLVLVNGRLASMPRLGFRSFLAGATAPLLAGALSYLYPYPAPALVPVLSAAAGAVAVVLAAPRLFRFRIRVLTPRADPQRGY